MKILVTNDDGISAPGLRALVESLCQVATVLVVAPHKERSAIGTAVTLRSRIRVRQVKPLIPGIETYAVEGTPSDCVMLGLTKLVEDKTDLVISGINQGPNLGEDVLISGTVGAALQGYLHGCSSIAISVDARENPFFDTAAELAALLAKRIIVSDLPDTIFLNVNVPNLPIPLVKGLESTHLAKVSHTNTFKEEGNNEEGYYRLIRQRINKPAADRTDVWAIERDIISITPLRPSTVDDPSLVVPDGIYSDLLKELRHR